MTIDYSVMLSYVLLSHLNAYFISMQYFYKYTFQVRLIFLKNKKNGTFQEKNLLYFDTGRVT